MIIDNPNLFIAKNCFNSGPQKVWSHTKYSAILHKRYIQYLQFMKLHVHFFFYYMHQPINHAQIQRTFLVVLGIPLFGLPDFGLVEGL